MVVLLMAVLLPPVPAWRLSAVGVVNLHERLLMAFF